MVPLLIRISYQSITIHDISPIIMSVFRAAEYTAEKIGNTVKNMGNGDLEKRVKALELEVIRLRRLIERTSKQPSAPVEEEDNCIIS